MLILFASTSCKPTEKGYRNAYDAALNKRQSTLGDLDVNISPDEIQEIDGMQLKTVDGVKVWVLNTRITPVNEEMKLPGNYNVAVGYYKMITNCQAQAEALKEEGMQAFPAKDSEGDYYTIAGSFQFLKEAVKFDLEYQKRKNSVYVGLHNAPVIIYSPK